MLIENQVLNMEEFKSIFNTLDWRITPRQLSINTKDYFYVGSYEDSDKIIKVIVRPSNNMSISESFKNRMQDGSEPVKSYTGRTYEVGTTVEVRIDNSILDKIKSVAKYSENKIKTQSVSWE